MPAKVRESKGSRTIYVEHGVWYDEGTKHLHVTIPGARTKDLGAGRWPESAPSAMATP